MEKLRLEVSPSEAQIFREYKAIEGLSGHWGTPSELIEVSNRLRQSLQKISGFLKEKGIELSRIEKVKMPLIFGRRKKYIVIGRDAKGRRVKVEIAVSGKTNFWKVPELEQEWRELWNLRNQFVDAFGYDLLLGFQLYDRFAKRFEDVKRRVLSKYGVKIVSIGKKGLLWKLVFRPPPGLLRFVFPRHLSNLLNE